MDQFLEDHKLPKLNQDETVNQSSPIKIKEIEFVINKLLKKNFPGPDGVTRQFYALKELTAIVYNKFFRKQKF